MQTPFDPNQPPPQPLWKRSLRVVVPLAILAIGVGLFFVLARSGSSSRSSPAPATNVADSAAHPDASAPSRSIADSTAQTPPDAQRAGGSQPPPDPAPTSAQPPAAADSQSVPSPTGSAELQPAPLSAPAAAPRVLVPAVFPQAPLTAIGAPDLSSGGVPAPESSDRLRVTFTSLGAGIESIALTPFFETVRREPGENVIVQNAARIPDASGRITAAVAPLAAIGVEIDGVFVDLTVNPAGSVWRQTAPGSFEAFILTPDGSKIARITRQYAVTPGSYSISLTQRYENLTDQRQRVVWRQFGPTDLPLGVVRYGGDIRRARFGYIYGPKSPGAAPASPFVEAGEQLTAHAKIIDAAGSGVAPLWPNRATERDALQPVWAAMTNRYFGVAIHPVPGATVNTLSLFRTYDAVVLNPTESATERRVATMRLTTPEFIAEPNSPLDLSAVVYAGPLSKKTIDREPGAAAFGLDQIVLYTFGGPCAFCTFQTVTHFLAWFLGWLHDGILHDWALAIMVLVVCVRTILHPVTRWSQVNLARFGKQMQALAPKQKKLQEKFQGDPMRLRQETARLMKEENINYFGALGCLPMFLQMPIWIALYAMLFFNFELRHQPAFFGLFQSLASGAGFHWSFLADLAEPDHFIPLGTSISIPLISSLMGPIESVNILPLVMGVVFYVQQKYLAPPTSAAMTPEMEQQQKMMRVISVIMFPLFMYNAPAGLSVYFLTNSTLGILESRHIRKQVEKMDLLAKPAKTGQPGFLSRLRQYAEARSAMHQEAKKLQSRLQQGNKAKKK